MLELLRICPWYQQGGSHYQEPHSVPWTPAVLRARVASSLSKMSSRFELVKQSRFAKTEHNKEKRLEAGEKVLDLWIILWKMQRILIKFCKLNSFFVFLCLIKLKAMTFRSTKIFTRLIVSRRWTLENIVSQNSKMIS